MTAATTGPGGTDPAPGTRTTEPGTGRRTTTTPTDHDPFAALQPIALPRLNRTDRAVLALLDEHDVLTTAQIARALFGSSQTAATRHLNPLWEAQLVQRDWWGAQRLAEMPWTLG